jgi:SAM-dependent methyltransferase
MELELYEQIYQIEQTHWWYVARREIIFDYLKNAEIIESRNRILDVGCGTGSNLEYLQTNYSNFCVGLDLSMDALKYSNLRNTTNLVCGDGLNLPFSESTFDLILALDLLEHIDDDFQALNEFTRLLAPGGYLILFVPAFNFLWGLQDEVSHHYRRYSAKEIRSLISQNNLEFAKLTYTNFFLFPIIFFGRLFLRFYRNKMNIVSENDLSPGLINTILLKIFLLERPLVKHLNFPFGVSIFCIAQKLYE